MTVAIYTGTFSPPTIGHFDVIKRASKLYGKVIIGVFENSGKNTLFTVAERIEMLRLLTNDLENVAIISSDGLVADYCVKNKVDVILRSLRASGDFDHEFQMAAGNRHLGNVETVVLLSKPEYAFISSTLVREIGAKGGDLKGLVPEILKDRIAQKFRG